MFLADLSPPTPEPSVSVADYYNVSFGTMDYLCCAENRVTAGVQTEVEKLVEVLGSGVGGGSEEKSTSQTLVPLGSNSPVLIPPPIVTCF